MLPELYDEDANLFLTELMSGLSEIIPVKNSEYCPAYHKHLVNANHAYSYYADGVSNRQLEI